MPAETDTRETETSLATLPALPPEFAHLTPGETTETDHGLTTLYGPDWDLCPLREEL